MDVGIFEGMTEAERVVAEDTARLLAEWKAKKYAESPEGQYMAWLEQREAKRKATIARRKPINDAIRRQQANWDKYQRRRWFQYWRDQMSERELYEPFFRRIYLDDWSE